MEQGFRRGAGRAMVMVVRCKSCMNAYRLDEALLKGAKGALIRCPKCRESIIVENPRATRVAPPIPNRVLPPTAPPVGDMVPLPIAPPVAPRAAFEMGFPPILLEAPGGMASPVPQDLRAEEADISGMIPFEPPDVAGVKELRLEDLFIHPSAVEGDRIPGGVDDRPVETRSPRPGWNPPPGRRRNRRPLFLAAAISILLVAGGTFYFVDGNFGRKPSGHVFPAQPQSPSGHPVFDVQNLKGHLNEQATGERLYVIEGTVTNVGKTLSRGIRIQATLLGMDNQAIMQNETFAGNLIDESLMTHMNRVRIEGFLGMRYGEGNTNRDIPVGMSLPFMVVFFDPPEGIQSFTVKALDVGEAERIQSPDAEKTDNRVSTQQTTRQN